MKPRIFKRLLSKLGKVVDSPVIPVAGVGVGVGVGCGVWGVGVGVLVLMVLVLGVGCWCWCVGAGAGVGVGCRCWYWVLVLVKSEVTGCVSSQVYSYTFFEVGPSRIYYNASCCWWCCRWRCRCDDDHVMRL